MECFSFPSFLCSIHIYSQNMPRNFSENAATYSSFVSKINITSRRLFSNLKFSQFNCSVMFDSLRPYGLQHARLPCPSPTPGACSNSCPLSQWCHPTISSSVTLFSSRLQSFPASGSFPLNQFFISCGQRIGASASSSVFPMNSQDWFPLDLTGLISLQSKGFSTVFS